MKISSIFFFLLIIEAFGCFSGTDSTETHLTKDFWLNSFYAENRRSIVVKEKNSLTSGVIIDGIITDISYNNNFILGKQYENKEDENMDRFFIYDYTENAYLLPNASDSIYLNKKMDCVYVKNNKYYHKGTGWGPPRVVEHATYFIIDIRNYSSEKPYSFIKYELKSEAKFFEKSAELNVANKIQLKTISNLIP